MRRSPLHTLALASVAGLALLVHGGGSPAQAEPQSIVPAPAITDQIITTFRGRQLEIAGAGFGTPAPDSELVLDDGTSATHVASDSLYVASWADALIRIWAPPGVRSGTVAVTARGATSDARQLLVFDYTFRGMPERQTIGVPLDLAADQNGHLWVNDEFHTALSSYPFDATGPLSAIPVPQFGPPWIFAQNLYGDTPSAVSILGEDVDIDSQGNVWFTQGGGYLYFGAYRNVSRIVEYQPSSGTFHCYNVPTDDAEVVGLLLDEHRGLVWFAEGALDHGNAISAFDPSTMASNCMWDASTETWSSVCLPQGPQPPCFRRYPLPNTRSSPAHLALDGDGDVWFTESWGNRLGRLTPETGELLEVPLPAPSVLQGSGLIVGSMPWQLAFDDNGDLWVNEYFDAKIFRVRPSLMSTHDCTALDGDGNNPCAQEIYHGSNGIDDKTIHTLDIGNDGRVWFSLSGGTDAPRLGFISTHDGNAVAFLPALNVGGTIAGIAEDHDRNTLWFAMFDARRIGRLDLVTRGSDGDGDGCADAEERGAAPTLGGERDPTNAWDFYDLNGSRTIDSLDIAMLRSKFSPAHTRAGDLAFDRSRGSFVWAPGPPDGKINAIDIALVRAGYGHTCLAPP